MKKNKSANDWLYEVMQNVNFGGKPDKIPDGWLTEKQMREMMQVPESTMRCRVVKFVQNGVLEKKQFKILTGAGVMQVWHYHKT
jgi:hypothetical protein